MTPGATLLLLFGGGGAGPTPSPSYELKWWMEELFGHTVDLWEPTRTIDATTGEVSAETWVKRWANVRCYQDRKPSASQIESSGRTEQDDLFTRDIFWMHEHQQIDDSWLIILKTVDRNGDNHPDYGKGWRCAGDARKRVDNIGEEGHIEIVSVAEPSLPAGVS